MLNRRTFFGNAATGAVAACAASGGQAQSPSEPKPGNPSGVGGYGYRLPEFEKGSRLLFQGDSITDMKWGRNEKDRNHYLGHSYVYLIASRLGVDMPEAELNIFNRGMSGHKVGDLKARWQKDAIEMKPDLLSVLIGVNDISKSSGNPVPLEAWEADYRHILDLSREANADLRLVLLDPFVLASGRLKDAEKWKTWRGEVDKLGAVVAQLAKDYGAVHIEIQAVFDQAAEAASPEQWIWDGVHPLPQGHELIARQWLEAVSGRWPGD